MAEGLTHITPCINSGKYIVCESCRRHAKTFKEAILSANCWSACWTPERDSGPCPGMMERKEPAHV